jgi:hypothetical protein
MKRKYPHPNPLPSDGRGNSAYVMGAYAIRTYAIWIGHGTVCKSTVEWFSLSSAPRRRDDMKMAASEHIHATTRRL